jgi:NDP-sugar pyrophosphorylase family protein
MNGDLLTALDYSEMFDAHRLRGNLATVATFTRHVNVDLGVIEADSANRVTDYIEKPVLTFEASTGVYFFEPAVLSYIPLGERLDLPELIKTLIAAGERVGRYAFAGHWLDIGRHDDYAEAVRLFEAHRDDFLPGDTQHT